MSSQVKFNYVPLATARNKEVFKELVPGVRALIDVININPPHDRKVWHAWIEVAQQGDGPASFWFQDDGTGAPQNIGFADEVREAFATADTII